LPAAREAVVQAAMAWHLVDYSVHNSQLGALRTACATLDALEKG